MEANSNMLKFVIACENAFLTQGSNTLNIINIIDKIISKEFPTGMSKLTVVSKITGEIGIYTHVIRIVRDGDNSIIAELPGKIEIKDSKSYAQYIGNFFNLPFKNPGKYRIEIEIENINQELNAELYVEQQ